MTRSPSPAPASPSRPVEARSLPGLLRIGITIALLGASRIPWAADCSVTASGVNFGAYDPSASADLEGAGDVDVRCDQSTSFSVALDPGSGTYAARALHAGPYVLNYNLYTGPGFAPVWGDGSSTTAVVPGTGIHSTLTIYGRIPAQQNAHVGSYVDNVVVTLTF
jgi:spore coat protein U-like protein